MQNKIYKLRKLLQKMQKYRKLTSQVVFKIFTGDEPLKNENNGGKSIRKRCRRHVRKQHLHRTPVAGL